MRYNLDFKSMTLDEVLDSYEEIIQEFSEALNKADREHKTLQLMYEHLDALNTFIQECEEIWPVIKNKYKLDILKELSLKERIEQFTKDRTEFLYGQYTTIKTDAVASIILNPHNISNEPPTCMYA